MASTEEQAHAYIDQLMARAQERAVQAQAMAAEMESMRVVGQSDDRSAEVTLSSTGALVDLYIGPSLQGAGGEAVRAALMQANAAAQRELTTRATEVTARHFGADSETTREFSGRYADLFGTPGDEGDGPDAGPGVLR